MSLKNRTLSWLMKWYELDPTRFVNGGEAERQALEIGFKASNCSRRLRKQASWNLQKMWLMYYEKL